MNIAHLLPYSATFPLKKHNGRYEWVLRLAQLQATKGHTVTIYSSPSSTGESISWRSISTNFEDKTRNNIELITYALQQPEHNIFHSHFDSLHYQLADTTTKPIVATEHWFPAKVIADASHANTTGNVTAVPVTNYMQAENKRLGIKSSQKIYHGIDLTRFHPSPNPRSDRLIYVGRIAPHKGVKEAVTIATAANENLDIVGKINDVDQAYWQEILPLVDGKHIRYLGPKTQVEVASLLAHAKAFLFPAQAAEAFGQVTIEAQACDTPVIISAVGASNELVKHGITGFIATTETEFLEAFKQLPSIKLGACRTFAEQFDIQTMVSQYDQLYRQLLAA